jgi:hypothetical protein
VIAALDRRDWIGAVRLQPQNVAGFELSVLVELAGFSRMLKPDRE